ncbi:hypothetical protein Bbelb_317720 [Branchiostoma belcheri]|nr:hypothetical protein Bbelb_317720 [Branchiostoma belcheri]
MAANNTPRKECEEIGVEGIPSDRCANCANTFQGTMRRHRRNIFGTDTRLSSAAYSIKQAVESLADLVISSVSKQHAVFVCNDCFYSVKSFVAGNKKTREAKQKFQEAGTSGFLSRRAGPSRGEEGHQHQNNLFCYGDIFTPRYLFTNSSDCTWPFRSPLQHPRLLTYLRSSMHQNNLFCYGDIITSRYLFTNPQTPQTVPDHSDHLCNIRDC